MTSTVDFMTGRVGSGKTLHAVYTAMKKIKDREGIIVGNIHIFLKQSRFVEPKDIILSLNPKNNNLNPLIELLNNEEYKVFILDEIDKWFHSRQHMKPFSIWLSAFITQIRKRNMDIIMTAQRPSALDLSGRHAVDNWIRCVGKYYPKPYDRIPYKFKYSSFNEDTGKRKLYSMKARNVQWLYDYYDTKEIIVPADILMEIMK